MKNKIEKIFLRSAKLFMSVFAVMSFLTIGVAHAQMETLDFGNAAGTQSIDDITMDAFGLNDYAVVNLNTGMEVVYELTGEYVGPHNGEVGLYVAGDTDDTAEIFSTLPNSSVAIFGSPRHTPNGGVLTHNEVTDPNHPWVYVYNEDMSNPIGVSHNLTLTVTVGGLLLISGTDVENIDVPDGQWRFYQVDVLAGTTELEIVTNSGSGNADLYHKFGDYPTLIDFDNSSTGGTNSETITITNPSVGIHYFGIYSNGATTSGLTLSPTITSGGGGAVPEFSDYMLILTVLIAVGFMYKLVPNINFQNPIQR